MPPAPSWKVNFFPNPLKRGVGDNKDEMTVRKIIAKPTAKHFKDLRRGASHRSKKLGELTGSCVRCPHLDTGSKMLGSKDEKKGGKQTEKAPCKDVMTNWE